MSWIINFLFFLVFMNGYSYSGEELNKIDPEIITLNRSINQVQKTLRNEDLFQVAKLISKLTRDILVNGNDNPYSGLPSTYFRLNSEEYRAFISESIQRVRTNLNNFQQQYNLTPETAAIVHMKNILYAKVGNCGEHALTAFCLAYLGGVREIFLCCFERNDHAFLLMRHNEENIVLCDPWANAYGKLSSSELNTDLLINDGNFKEWQQYIWGRPLDENAIVYDLKCLLHYSGNHSIRDRNNIFYQVFYAVSPGLRNGNLTI